MFDTGSGGGTGVGMHDFGEDRLPERRQYTLKGVEADTIRLMRFAATKEGMKIGSWVSLRMREAAERALSSSLPASQPQNDPKNSRSGDTEVQDFGSAAEILKHVLALLERQEQRTEDRFRTVELELHQITSGQRSILSALITSR